MLQGGVEYAEFYLHPQQKKKKPEFFCTAPVVERRAIRSSNGQVEDRIIIRTAMRIGEREFPIDLSLTNRDSMGFRMLIGRDALKRRFVIHPGKSFLLGK